MSPDAPGAGAAEAEAAQAAAAAQEAKVKENLPNITKFAETFLGKPAEPETPEAKAAREQKEQEEKETKAREAAEKKGGKPKPAAKPKAKAIPPPALTADQIAEAAARGVASAIQPKPDETKKGAKAPEASPSEKRRLAVLEHLATLQPDKYKDVVAQYQSAQEKIKAYADKWEAENPGKVFNEDDAEHEEFYNQNNLMEPWEEDDFQEAAIDLGATQAASKKFEEKEKEINAKLSEIEKWQKLNSPETKEAIDKHQVDSANIYWNANGEEFKGLLDEKGNFIPEKLKAAREADPTGFDIKYNAGAALDNEVSELYKMMSGLVKVNMENPVHRVWSQFAQSKEQALAKRPDEEKLNAEGKHFLPAAEFYKKSKKDQQEHYWTFSIADLAAMRASEMSKNVAKFIAQQEEQFEKMAAARGIKIEKKAVKGEPRRETDEEREAREEAEAAAAAANGKPKSPGDTSGTRLAASREAASGADKNPLNAFANSFLGRR